MSPQKLNIPATAVCVQEVVAAAAMLDIHPDELLPAIRNIGPGEPIDRGLRRARVELPAQWDETVLALYVATPRGREIMAIAVGDDPAAPDRANQGLALVPRSVKPAVRHSRWGLKNDRITPVAALRARSTLGTDADQAAETELQERLLDRLRWVPDWLGGVRFHADGAMGTAWCFPPLRLRLLCEARRVAAVAQGPPVKVSFDPGGAVEATLQELRSRQLRYGDL